MIDQIAFVDCQTLPEAVKQRTGCSGFFDAFVQLFEQTGQKNLVYTRYEAARGEFPDLDDSSLRAVFISGSFSSAYDEDLWIQTLKHNIQRARGRIPLVGICFGHQVIAEALGGKCGSVAAGPEVGCVSTQLTARGRELFRRLSGGTLDADTVCLIYFHFDEVQVLPPGAVLLASSPSCPVEGYLLPEDRILCLQGHPEFGATTELMPALLSSSLERGRLKLDAYWSAAASLKVPQDGHAIGACLLEFAVSDPKSWSALRPWSPK